MKKSKTAIEKKFDSILDSFLYLEKYIEESKSKYNDNKSDELKDIIINLCNIGKSQINTLLNVLPNVYNGIILKNYRINLEIKRRRLYEIEKEILDLKENKTKCLKNH